MMMVGVTQRLFLTETDAIDTILVFRMPKGVI